MMTCSNCGWEPTDNSILHPKNDCIARLKADRDDWRNNASFRAGVLLSVSHKYHTACHVGEFEDCPDRDCTRYRELLNGLREFKQEKGEL